MSLRKLGNKYRTGLMLGLCSVALVGIIAACVSSKKKDERKDTPPAKATTTTSKAVGPGPVSPAVLASMTPDELQDYKDQQTEIIQEGMANIGEQADSAGDTQTADTMAQVAELPPEVIQAVAEVKDPDNVAHQADAEPVAVVADDTGNAIGENCGLGLAEECKKPDSTGAAGSAADGGDSAAGGSETGGSTGGSSETASVLPTTGTTKTVVPDVGATWGDYAGAGAATTVAALAVGLATYGAVVKLGAVEPKGLISMNNLVVNGRAKLVGSSAKVKMGLAGLAALGLSAAAIYTVYSIANSTNSSTNISLALAGASLAASLGLGIYYAKNPEVFVKFTKLIGDIKVAAKVPAPVTRSWVAIREGVTSGASRAGRAANSLVDRIRGKKPTMPAISFKEIEAAEGKGKVVDTLSDALRPTSSAASELGHDVKTGNATKLKSFFQENVFTKKGGLAALAVTVVGVGVYAALNLEEGAPTDAEKVATAFKNLQLASQVTANK